MRLSLVVNPVVKLPFWTGSEVLLHLVLL